MSSGVQVYQHDEGSMRAIFVNSKIAKLIADVTGMSEEDKNMISTEGKHGYLPCIPSINVTFPAYYSTNDYPDIAAKHVDRKLMPGRYYVNPHAWSKLICITGPCHVGDKFALSDASLKGFINTFASVVNNADLATFSTTLRSALRGRSLAYEHPDRDEWKGVLLSQLCKMSQLNTGSREFCVSVINSISGRGDEVWRCIESPSRDRYYGGGDRIVADKVIPGEARGFLGTLSPSLGIILSAAPAFYEAMSALRPNYCPCDDPECYIRPTLDIKFPWIGIGVDAEGNQVTNFSLQIPIEIGVEEANPKTWGIGKFEAQVPVVKYDKKLKPTNYMKMATVTGGIPLMFNDHTYKYNDQYPGFTHGTCSNVNGINVGVSRRSALLPYPHSDIRLFDSINYKAYAYIRKNKLLPFPAAFKSKSQSYDDTHISKQNGEMPYYRTQTNIGVFKYKERMFAVIVILDGSTERETGSSVIDITEAGL